MLFAKKPGAPVLHERSRLVGLDLTSTRVRGASVGAGKSRPLLLDAPHEDLALVANLNRKTPEIGRIGYGLLKALPHATASNFLPQLGQNRAWTAGRTSVSAESALGLAFDKVRTAVAADAEAAALALPAYLTPRQVAAAVEIAGKAKLPLRGTASAPLALASRLAGVVLEAREESSTASCSVVVVDADDYALNASVVEIEPREVRLAATSAWPRSCLRVWKDRLLDAVADRCVRLCRRDPRESADSEQALFEQLDDALESARHGQPIRLSLRAAHWYQDVTQQPDEFDGYCAILARDSADAIRDLVLGSGLPLPPRAVWLTPAAGRLPGLANAVYKSSSERTQIAVLSPNAVAEATAALVPQWLAGELPRAHLDHSVMTGIRQGANSTSEGRALGKS